MATLLNRSLGALLDAPGVTEVSPQVEAFVARIATLALTVAEAAPAAAVNQALAAGSPEALIGAFAELVATRGPTAPGAQVALRGRIALAEALARSGGLWRADEAQAHLGVSRATLQTWRNRRKVLALSLGDGSFGYPVAQFAPPATDLDRPRPLPGLADVLRAAGDALTPAELVALLVTPHPALEERTAWEALAAGDSAAVTALVAHVATPADAGAPPPRG